MKTLGIAVLLAHSTVLLAQYQYYQSDTFSTIDTTKWTSYGGSSSAQGLTSGTMISTVPVPDGSAEYEVKSTVTFQNQSTGTFSHFLRSSGGNSASYEFQLDVNCSWNLYRYAAPNYTLIASGYTGCHSGSVLRTVVKTWPSAQAVFWTYIDDILIMAVPDADG